MRDRRSEYPALTAYVAAHGEGPWPCARCGEPVTWGAHPTDNSKRGVIHHEDRDRTNNDVSNLWPMHHGCHKTHHMLGHEVSEETREKIAATKRGKPRDAATRRKIGDAQRGRTLSEEHKRRISEGLNRYHGNQGAQP